MATSNVVCRVCAVLRAAACALRPASARSLPELAAERSAEASARPAKGTPSTALPAACKRSLIPVPAASALAPAPCKASTCSRTPSAVSHQNTHHPKTAASANSCRTRRIGVSA